MDAVKDPFEVLVVEEQVDGFEQLTRKPLLSTSSASVTSPSAATARFHGFDLEDRPLIADLLELPGEVVAARATVSLLHGQIGSTVLVLFDRGDVRRPVIVGVIQEHRAAAATSETSSQRVTVQADDDRLVLSAEREIVLRCGDATITLTRAGKVLIKGRYILSRSSGYNKIKGAAVDIN